MTQEDGAPHLEVSRSTVVPMELGNRAVTGIELSRLAHPFGKDLKTLAADNAPDKEDMLLALFRHHPELSTQEHVREALRRCATLCNKLARRTYRMEE